MKLRFSTFMDVNDRSLASADPNARHLMDGLDDVLVCFASATSSIAYGGDGENARPFRNTTEISGPSCCLFLRIVEVVVDFEGRMTGESEREPLPNAVVGLGFEGNDGWYIGNGDPDRRDIKFTDSLTSTGVADLMDANDMLTKIEVAPGNSKVVSV